MWLLQVLVVALEIFDLHRSMQDLFSCGMQKNSLVAACKLLVVACKLSCGMWDLVPWLRTEPGPSALRAQSLSHWTTREVARLRFWTQLVNLINKTQGDSLYRTHSWLIVLVLQISRDLQATITLTQRRVPFNITLEFLVLLDELFLLLSLLC